MSVVLAGLAPVQLERIADVLAQSVHASSSMGGLRPLASEVLPKRVQDELVEHIAAVGHSGVAHLLRAVAAERRASTQKADSRLELVFTGPERDGTGTRDTAVVVRELFQSAERDVLVAGFALYNARAIFEPLVECMAARHGMRVRLFLNISPNDLTQSEADAAFEFRRRFRTYHWPEGPLPEVYYDPRAFARDPAIRAVMHAKCVLVDDARTFVTSANLTEAAQARNIELGIVINDSRWARSVRRQFDDLIERNMLAKLDLATL